MAALLVPAAVLLFTGPAEAGAARDRLDRALRGLVDARASFTQTRKDALGTKTNPGVLEYRAPRRVRLEYRGAVPMTILVEADTAWIYQPLQKQVLRTRASRAGAPPLPFLAESLETLERAYVVRETGPLDLVLEPRKSEGLSFRQIAMSLDAATGLPKKVVVSQHDGGSISLAFEPFRVNPGLPASRFVPRFPDGTTVVEL